MAGLVRMLASIFSSIFGNRCTSIGNNACMTCCPIPRPVQGYAIHALRSVVVPLPIGFARTATLLLGLARTVVNVVRPFQRDRANLWRFFLTSTALENVAPTFDKHQLMDHYQTLAPQKKKKLSLKLVKSIQLNSAGSMPHHTIEPALATL
jgi:hypothetical protein